MDQQPLPNQEPQNSQPTVQQSPLVTGPAVLTPEYSGTPPSLQQAPLAPKGKPFKKVVIMLLIVLLIGSGVAAYWFFIRKDSPKQANPQTDTSSVVPEVQNSEPELKTWKPNDLDESLSMVHDPAWTEKYWVGVKGLVKDVNGSKYLITLSSTPFDYDYMDRAAGGAFPPGTLYKSVTTGQGKTVHIGTFSFSAKQDGAFLSTCPLTDNGGCSIKRVYSDGSQGYWLVELSRYLPEEDTDPINLVKAKTYLDLSNQTDKQVLDEFVTIMSTLTY